MRPASGTSLRRWLVAAVVVLGATLLPLHGAAAHDVPDEFMLDTYIKPDDGRLHVVVRAQLAMLLDMRLPKRGPGYIDLADRQLDAALEASAVALAGEFGLYENGRRLTVDRHRSRLSVPADRAFITYAQAVSHVAGPPLPLDTNLFWNQGWFDAHFEYAIDSPHSRFALRMGTDPSIARRLHVLITFLPPDGGQLRYDVLGDAGRVPLDPRWHEAAWLFAKAGWWRLLTGAEQLLFLLLVVLPFRRRLHDDVPAVAAVVPAVAAVAAAFAVAAVPLVSATLAEQRWWAALAGAVIAVSILALAVVNVVSPTLRWWWVLACAFGVAHGAQLSSGLDQVLQFGGGAMAVSRTAFLLGVYAALAVVVTGMLLLLRGLFLHPLVARYGVLAVSLVAGHQAWHWTLERFGVLSVLPAPQADLLAAARATVVVLLVAAAVWLGYESAAARRQASRAGPATGRASEAADG